MPTTHQVSFLYNNSRLKLKVVHGLGVNWYEMQYTTTVIAMPLHWVAVQNIILMQYTTTVIAMHFSSLCWAQGALVVLVQLLVFV